MRIRKRTASTKNKKSPGLAPHRRAKKPGSSVMRQSTWENMSKGERLKEYGTTSYKKYKEGKMAASGSRSGGGGEGLGNPSKGGPGGPGTGGRKGGSPGKGNAGSPR